SWLAPRLAIVRRTASAVPCPTSIMAMTEAMPMAIPRQVSTDRSRWRRSARSAVRTFRETARMAGSVGSGSLPNGPPAPDGRPLAVDRACASMPRRPSRLLLGVEGGLDPAGQVGGRPLTPEVREEHGRLLADHVVVQRHDVDAGLAQRPQHRLHLRGGHDE